MLKEGNVCDDRLFGNFYQFVLMRLFFYQFGPFKFFLYFLSSFFNKFSGVLQVNGSAFGANLVVITAFEH